MTVRERALGPFADRRDILGRRRVDAAGHAFGKITVEKHRPSNHKILGPPR